MFFLLFSALGWKCEHNNLVKYLRALQQRELVTVGRLKEVSKTRLPINVHYDFRLIENITLDNFTCKNVNDKVTWGGVEYNCFDIDMVTPEKVQVVKETLTNVAKFFHETLNVTKYARFMLDGDSEHPVYPNGMSDDADLYLTVYARPFGGPESTTLASAGSYEGFITHDNTEERPQIGVVHINFAVVPSRSSDIDGESRNFFEVCVHETIHALGFSNNLYKYWKNRASGLKYSNVTQIVENPRYPKKKFNIFVTPKLIELFHDQFGYNDFAEGVEIEDGGDAGTAGSHFEIRTYFSELMCGTTYGYCRISEFSLGLLYDTGWYDVDFSKAEPLIFGNYRAIVNETEPFKDFPFGAPDAYFPPGYLSNESKLTCSPDHFYGGFFNVQNYDCATTPGHPCCIYPEFTDSLHLGICDPVSDIQDHVTLPIPYPNRMCPDKEALTDNPNVFNMAFGKNSFCTTVETEVDNVTYTYPNCYKMNCNENNELFLEFGNSSLPCASEGDGYIIGEIFKIYCPDPKHICGIINYKLNNVKVEKPKEATSIPISSEEQTETKTNDPKVPSPTDVEVSTTHLQTETEAGTTIIEEEELSSNMYQNQVEEEGTSYKESVTLENEVMTSIIKAEITETAINQEASSFYSDIEADSQLQSIQHEEKQTTVTSILSSEQEMIQPEKTTIQQSEEDSLALTQTQTEHYKQELETSEAKVNHDPFDQGKTMEDSLTIQMEKENMITTDNKSDESEQINRNTESQKTIFMESSYVEVKYQQEETSQNIFKTEVETKPTTLNELSSEENLKSDEETLIKQEETLLSSQHKIVSTKANEFSSVEVAQSSELNMVQKVKIESKTNEITFRETKKIHHNL